MTDQNNLDDVLKNQGNRPHLDDAAPNSDSDTITSATNFATTSTPDDSNSSLDANTSVANSATTPVSNSTITGTPSNPDTITSVTNSATPPDSLPFPDPSPAANLNLPESDTFGNGPGTSSYAAPGHGTSSYAAPGHGTPGPSTSDSTSLPNPPVTFVTGGAPNFNSRPPAKTRSSLRVGILSGVCSAAAVCALFLGALNFGWIPVNSVSTTIYSGSNNSVSAEEIINRSNTSLSNPNWEAVARATGDAVVSISVTAASGTGQGSGAIIDSAGYIITNNHVIDGAQEIQVTLLNGSIIPAEVVGTDPTTDLAIIKITVDQELTAISLDKSSELTVGQPILAIGNPLGYANSVSTGVISALDRPIAVSAESTANSETIVTNAIQIDAAINPGNSGGPLFDGNGNIVGITSAIATTSDSGGSVGIGFAIPADLANKVAKQLIEKGSVTHAQVGIMIKDGSASLNGVQKNGAEIDSFAETGNAKSSGLKEKDLIVAIDGKSVINAIAFMGAIHTYLPDDKVTITVIRDGQLVDVEVTLTEVQTSTESSKTTPEYNTPEENPNQNSPWFFDPFSW
jgi:putative serine protease PepD